MIERTTFCEKCRNDVPFVVTEKKLTGNIKGVKYTYFGNEAHCSICSAELYIAEINDSNLKLLYDEYRKENSIIPLETILGIPEKCGIGKRPLSLLLGWGEQTFTRYCDGDMPTKQYSETLQKIYDDPYYYAEILEKNKESLKSPSAYEKSQKAVRGLLGDSKEPKTKIDIATAYLIDQCEDITPLAMQKALYYIQGFYYAFYNEFLFPEDCEAWVHGPVYREIYFKYRSYNVGDTVQQKEFDTSVFSSSEKAILDSIIKSACCYSGKVLEQFTHAEAPWISTRGNLPPSTASNKIIQKESIGTYFTSVKEKYNMLNPNDINSYMHAMFNHI